MERNGHVGDTKSSTQAIPSHLSKTHNLLAPKSANIGTSSAMCHPTDQFQASAHCVVEDVGHNPGQVCVTLHNDSNGLGLPSQMDTAHPSMRCNYLELEQGQHAQQDASCNRSATKERDMYSTDSFLDERSHVSFSTENLPSDMQHVLDAFAEFCEGIASAATMSRSDQADCKAPGKQDTTQPSTSFPALVTPSLVRQVTIQKQMRAWDDASSGATNEPKGNVSSVDISKMELNHNDILPPW